MGLIMNLIVLGITLPVGLIIMAICYPKNWMKRKIFYGIRYREVYAEDTARERIDALTSRARKQAWIITLCYVVIGVLLTIFHKIPLDLTLTVFNVFAYFMALLVPFAICNQNIKSVKHELSLDRTTGISLTDLAVTDTVHAYKFSALLLPLVLMIASFGFALAVDLKLITVDGFTAAGSYSATIMTGVFLFIGVLMTPIAYMMDRQRNQVISEDSTVNANYNRAIKKCTFGMNLAMIWSSAIASAGLMAAFLLFNAEMVLMIFMGVYMAAIVLFIIIYAVKMNKIEARYAKDRTVAEDDDDKWLFGLFYYNPADRKLNVEKRAGFGATINMAHPIGKVIGAVIALALIGTCLSFVWIGLLEMTPIHVTSEDGRVICHQLRDEYVIEESEIKSVSFVEDFEKRDVVRSAGSSMPGLAKGRFVVDDEKCRLFMNPDIDCCIRIETGDNLYYVSGETVEETMDLYNLLAK